MTPASTILRRGNRVRARRRPENPDAVRRIHRGVPVERPVVGSIILHCDFARFGQFPSLDLREFPCVDHRFVNRLSRRHLR